MIQVFEIKENTVRNGNLEKSQSHNTSVFADTKIDVL